ncbi:unnamed protein product [Parnassius apollo]|uniref:(apollo) hypothetical protein n=1 Tax=Parnassius apollo TaxID=110799 RepID=A0A8S3XIV7_PARAO|nr:unnamed protein product [Parnassius apollo]
MATLTWNTSFVRSLKNRVQRINENLQQWALAVEKLVRKAYRSVPALIEGNLVQTFIDGIRELEVRAGVRLRHHETLRAPWPMHWRWKPCGRIIVPIASGRLQQIQFATATKDTALGAMAVGKRAIFDPAALSKP